MKNMMNKSGIIRDREMHNEEPLLYHVWMHGDDFTPRGFSVGVLEAFFSMDRRKAIEVMQEARVKGMAVCGRYTKDVAESLLTRAIAYARSYEHPLMYS